MSFEDVVLTQSTGIARPAFPNHCGRAQSKEWAFCVRRITCKIAPTARASLCQHYSKLVPEIEGAENTDDSDNLPVRLPNLKNAHRTLPSICSLTVDFRFASMVGVCFPLLACRIILAAHRVLNWPFQAARTFPLSQLFGVIRRVIDRKRPPSAYEHQNEPMPCQDASARIPDVLLRLRLGGSSDQPR